MFEALADLGVAGKSANTDVCYSLGFDVVSTLLQPQLSFPGELSLSTLRGELKLTPDEKEALQEIQA